MIGDLLANPILFFVAMFAAMLTVIFAIDKLAESGLLDALKGGVTWVAILGLFGLAMAAWALLAEQIKEFSGLQGEERLLNVLLLVAVSRTSLSKWIVCRILSPVWGIRSNSYGAATDLGVRPEGGRWAHDGENCRARQSAPPRLDRQ
jgi:hypothetical protein